MVEYNPNHPNANIHGMVGVGGEPICETGNGSLCTGCCYALEVRDANSDFKKNAGEPCEYQLYGQGCRFVLENASGRPFICGAYHCSSDIYKLATSPDPKIRNAAFQRIAMSATAALHNGEITVEQYNSILNRFGENSPNPEVQDDLSDAPEDDIINWLLNKGSY